MLLYQAAKDAELQRREDEEHAMDQVHLPIHLSTLYSQGLFHRSVCAVALITSLLQHVTSHHNSSAHAASLSSLTHPTSLISTHHLDHSLTGQERSPEEAPRRERAIAKQRRTRGRDPRPPRRRGARAAHAGEGAGRRDSAEGRDRGAGAGAEGPGGGQGAPAGGAEISTGGSSVSMSVAMSCLIYSYYDVSPRF